MALRNQLYGFISTLSPCTNKLYNWYDCSFKSLIFCEMREPPLIPISQKTIQVRAESMDWYVYHLIGVVHVGQAHFNSKVSKLNQELSEPIKFLWNWVKRSFHLSYVCTTHWILFPSNQRRHSIFSPFWYANLGEANNRNKMKTSFPFSQLLYQ